MSDVREALVARQRGQYGELWDVLVPEVGWTLGQIIESVIEDALSDVTEPEWEYGVWWGDDGYVTNCGERELAEQRAAASFGDKIVRRIAARTIPAGPWEEVPDE